MENMWLACAKRLQSIASTGLHFSQDKHDKERYEEIAAIANKMLSLLGSVPVSRIQSLVSDFAQGYATPKVDVRGAVIEREKVLLVRETSDGLWTLPGGFADVGISPSENIVKEIWEEASIKVEATRLYSIRHKAKHGYNPDARDFYKLFFLCDSVLVAALGRKRTFVNVWKRPEAACLKMTPIRLECAQSGPNDQAHLPL